MIGLGIALLIAGYGLFYYGENNIVSGGAGPTFAATFNLKTPLKDDNTGVANVLPSSAPMGSSNQTGQPATSNPSPAQVVRNV